eukprot:m.80115 g.80115  ORF g.80115 m.80115 type:complete len:75 (+) comp36170_c0_seq2:193-417(+)
MSAFSVSQELPACETHSNRWAKRFARNGGNRGLPGAVGPSGLRGLPGRMGNQLLLVEVDVKVERGQKAEWDSEE